MSSSEQLLMVVEQLLWRLRRVSPADVTSFEDGGLRSSAMEQAQELKAPNAMVATRRLVGEDQNLRITKEAN